MILDEISTGASGDLQSVTNTARAMVTRWGMSDELGPIVFGEQQEQVFLGKTLDTSATIVKRLQQKSTLKFIVL